MGFNGMLKIKFFLTLISAKAFYFYIYKNLLEKHRKYQYLENKILSQNLCQNS